ncbi:hypothetical protein C2I27_04160 [Priestia megaterium]|uniref:hypothetical protein n=1 Tax=Priestia megaterium TaxID=1404 RepID=UPI000D520FD5|nr:hypothetical protein [Priestia megaterium]PVC75087.1 hypothetical protein C2I27_04160 [Priestia megaterium]
MAIQTRLEDMVIGDKIRCEWYSNNGSLDSNNHFYKIGTSVLTLGNAGLFNQSTATGFYFIYVGKDFKDRMILIADRNVSHTITWDKLNIMGYATKDGSEVTSLGLDPTQWKTNIRLLTGSTFSDKATNSEWDKYIVNGTGGGQYPPGDDSTWHWNEMYSWVSSTASNSTSDYRGSRGNATVSWWTSYSSNAAPSNYGFRPVLVAESLAQPIQNKYLIQDGNEIKTFLNNTWSTIGAAPATKVMFDQGLSVSSLTVETLQQLNSSKPELLCWTDEVNPTRHVTMTGDMWEPVSQELPTVELFTEQGMKDLRSVPSEAWNALRNDFDVVTYTNLVDGNQAVRVQATPYAQLVFAETDFSIVEDLTITGASDGIKVIVSGNGGITWKTYDSQWVEVNANSQEAKSKGMTIAAFNALTKEMWALIGDNIRLAYYIENEGKVDSVTVQKQPSSIQTPSLDKVSITYDELTIEGRLKDLEEMNAINLIKLQFKANALMQASKYTLHDLVVDTFETDTAITTSSDSSQIIPKSFNDPVPLEDGFISEITLDEFTNFTRVTIS